MPFSTPVLVAKLNAGAVPGTHWPMVDQTQIRHFCFSNGNLRVGAAGSGPPVTPRSALVTTPSQFGA